jgi:uncharacterized membrane protein
MTEAIDPWTEEELPPPGDGESKLLAIEFDDAMKAQEALLASLRLHKRQTIEVEDAAIVVKERSGRIRIHQTKDVDAPKGAMAGSWVGLLGGLLFMAPLIGAVLGAAIGGIWAKLRDIGISDRQMKEMGEELRPGDAALFLLFELNARTTFLRELRRFDGTVLFTNLDEELRFEIEEALNELV